MNLPEFQKPNAAAPLLDAIKWTADGLVAAIVQDSDTSEVLMMAWMNAGAVERTVATGQTHFYSRSRRSDWHKGGTSGHVQYVDSIALDCDGDVLLIKVRQVGGACHEGYRSCFYRKLNADGGLETVLEPVFEKESVYGRPSGAAGSTP